MSFIFYIDKIDLYFVHVNGMEEMRKIVYKRSENCANFILILLINSILSNKTKL